MTRALLALALLLAGCVSFAPDEELTRLANEEGPRAGLPSGLRWEGRYCYGSPAAWLDYKRKVGVVCVPTCWPASGVRGVMRYEMAKIDWQLRAPWYLRPLASIDAALHLPPSEIYSWVCVLFPGDRND